MKGKTYSHTDEHIHVNKFVRMPLCNVSKKQFRYLGTHAMSLDVLSAARLMHNLIILQRHVIGWPHSCIIQPYPTSTREGR